MLFQAVVIFLPILNFFKFHVKGERSIRSANLFVLDGRHTLHAKLKANHEVQNRRQDRLKHFQELSRAYVSFEFKDAHETIELVF